MKTGALDISWAGERLTLLPERAVWWARGETLFIADPHFGKASAFRFAGIAVPETSHDDDLARLKLILAQYPAKQLVILGDFFHAKTGRADRTLSALCEWRERHIHLEIVLVIGNHDRHAGCPPEELKINCMNEPWPLGPFDCCHHPSKSIEGHFTLAGHIHPGFRLQERSGVSASSVCFHFGKHVAVLPAFGNFTGKHIVETVPGDRLFVVAEGGIIDATKLLRG